MKIKKSRVNNSADANVDSLSILTKYLLYPKKISLVGFKNCVNMLKKNYDKDRPIPIFYEEDI